MNANTNGKEQKRKCIQKKEKKKQRSDERTKSAHKLAPLVQWQLIDERYDLGRVHCRYADPSI